MTSKFALVIANTEYQDTSFAKLTAPGKDAEEFAQVLNEAELAAFNDVQILLNEGESKIRRAIARFFVDRKRDDLLLLYFSGHGIRNGQGQLFLAATDTEINILEATGIPAEFVTDAMNNSRSQRQLLILDCCNSGAFAYGSKSASPIGKSMGIATAFEGSGFGRVVLTATDATQFAWEGDKVIGDTQKSVFTHFLIEGLRGEADRDGDGRIHVDELYDYAYEQVVRRTPKQTPGKWSYKQQGDIVLRENLKPREVKAAPLPSELLEMLSHPNSGIRRAGIQELIGLLDSRHLGFVRAAQEKLREIAENDDSLSLRKFANDTLINHGIKLEQAIESSKEDLPAVKPTAVDLLIEKQKEQRRTEKPFSAPTREPSTPHATASRKIENKANIVGETTPKKLPEQKKVVPQRNIRLIGGIIGGLLVITLCILGGSLILNNMLVGPTRPTSTLPINLFATSTNQSDLAAFGTQTAKAQIPIVQTPTPFLPPMISDKDGMTLLYVPAGYFTMGSDNGFDDEKPAHTVYLDAFWIDKTEVTNIMYAKCVQDGKCNLPSQLYYGKPEYENYPVVDVSWDDANAYCSWVGRRLPTEAEWEKAARGTDGRAYPWGNTAPNNNLLNYNQSIDGLTEVGKYPNGVSPYGALDMAGNVFEWVADWYSENYYATLGENARNPQGPASGQFRAQRGGAWYVDPPFVRSASRLSGRTSANTGFRCAMSATP